MAKTHHEISGSLGLLVLHCNVLEGSRAAALIGDKVL